MKIINYFLLLYPLPKNKDVCIFIFCIMLPNIFFILISLFTVTSRPIINIDYLIALFFLFIPNFYIRIIGFIIFVIAIFFDGLMLLVQIFPFMNINALVYFFSFFNIIPLGYLVKIILFFIFSFFIIFLNICVTKKNKYPYFIIGVILVNTICVFIMSTGFKYSNFNAILGRNNYYLVSSQFKLYSEMTKTRFWEVADITPRLVPLEQGKFRAMNQLKVPFNNKILYIIAESWGELINENAQNEILFNIYSKSEKLEYIKHNSFYSSGSTVEGELRELCSFEIKNDGFALKKLENKVFKDCFPNKLNLLGYNLYSLHGTSGLLYDRIDWYKKAGFHNIMFGEHFMNLPRCTAFNGVCDRDLMKVISKIFRDNERDKIFVYWVTLTSHSPYAKKDIYNKRFKCEKYQIDPSREICQYAQLQTQFFDDFSELIETPEMQGVEVMIVGDHQPPMWGDGINYVKPSIVSYIHFKIKMND